jgi:CHAD domain-containing protein
MQREFPSAGAPTRTVRAILVAQIGRAITKLGPRARSDRAVHEVRKELKSARATLRLLRECVGVYAYRRDNALMRDAARPLTPLRDAKVLLQTLQRVDRTAGARKGNTFVRYLYRMLRNEQRDTQQRLRPKELMATIGTLRAVKQRLEALSGPQLDQPAALCIALERAYKSGRMAFAEVKRRPTDECLHEWRKQTKYFANQLEIVLLLSPKRFSKRLRRSLRLAEHLGDDHDLALLNDKIFQYAKGPNAASRNDAVEELISRIAHRRKTLQAKARRLGRRLYATKPRRIREKIEKSLRAATAKPLSNRKFRQSGDDPRRNRRSPP